jgi:23S rRNA (uracil1939-C5)-methyltransferase
VTVPLIEPGPARVEPLCSHFGSASGDSCGGCEWLHLEYSAQLVAKARSLAETLRRVGHLEPGAFELRPIIPSPRPLRYRSRAKFHFDRRSKKLVFFRRRSHDPVQLTECHLLEPGLDALRDRVGPALAAARIAPGEVALEWSAHQNRGSAWLGFSGVTPAVRDRAEQFMAAVPELVGLVLSEEGRARERRKGGRAQAGLAPVVIGAPVLRHERLPGDPSSDLVASRPDVFQQANRSGNALLVQTALDLLQPDREDVLELFCGAGNFTGPLAARARSVAAVEEQGAALELARATARPNTRFFAGDALQLARAFARESDSRFKAALLDPPRDGAKGIGPLLRDLGVLRTVYVSCDPATLARDLRGCAEAGLRTTVVQPIDMFPQTHHVECVAQLVRD